MLFKVLCVLLFIKTLKIDARRRIPISAITQRSTDMTVSVVNTTESIKLPHGFNPQPSPMNPLLYPFVTEEPIKIIEDATSGWRPIITSSTTKQRPTLEPFMEDRHAIASKESQESKTMEAPRKDSIIYGAWKPILTEAENSVTGNVVNNETNPIFRNVIRRRLGGFIEEIRHKSSPYKDSSEKSSSIESIEENLSNSRKQLQKKQGRRKISNFTKKEQYESIDLENNNSMNVVKVNASDPELFQIIKQINESAEASKILKTLSNETPTDDDSYAPTLQNSNPNKIFKEWPVDFINSSKGNRAQDTGSKDHFINFVGDSTEPPQSVSSVSFDDLLLPNTAFNITKMGIPFEEQNSDDEQSICVPLAVQERSASNPNEIVSVERVYCFPLPATDTKRTIENETVTPNKDANFSVLNYEELTTSSGANIKETIMLISISFLLV